MQKELGPLRFLRLANLYVGGRSLLGDRPSLFIVIIFK